MTADNIIILVVFIIFFVCAISAIIISERNVNNAIKRTNEKMNERIKERHEELTKRLNKTVGHRVEGMHYDDIVTELLNKIEQLETEK